MVGLRRCHRSHVGDLFHRRREPSVDRRLDTFLPFHWTESTRARSFVRSALHRRHLCSWLRCRARITFTQTMSTQRPSEKTEPKVAEMPPNATTRQRTLTTG